MLFALILPGCAKMAVKNATLRKYESELARQILPKPLVSHAFPNRLERNCKRVWQNAKDFSTIFLCGRLNRAFTENPTELIAQQPPNHLPAQYNLGVRVAFSNVLAKLNYLRKVRAA